MKATGTMLNFSDFGPCPDPIHAPILLWLALIWINSVSSTTVASVASQ